MIISYEEFLKRRKEPVDLDHYFWPNQPKVSATKAKEIFNELGYADAYVEFMQTYSLDSFHSFGNVLTNDIKRFLYQLRSSQNELS